MGCPPEMCTDGVRDTVAEELIVAYAARTLDPAAEIAFERHLKSCAHCRRLSAQQGAVWSALEAWRPPRISPDFDQKLARRIAESQSGVFRLAWFRRWVWRPALPLVAVCALLAGVFLLRDDDAPARTVVRPSAQIEQQVQHALDDMDMLKQIGVDVSAARIGASQKI
jgi:anti-sigma factor RsiW